MITSDQDSDSQTIISTIDDDLAGAQGICSTNGLSLDNNERQQQQQQPQATNLCSSTINNDTFDPAENKCKHKCGCSQSVSKFCRIRISKSDNSLSSPRTKPRFVINRIPGVLTALCEIHEYQAKGQNDAEQLSVIDFKRFSDLAWKTNVGTSASGSKRCFCSFYSRWTDDDACDRENPCFSLSRSASHQNSYLSDNGAFCDNCCIERCTIGVDITDYADNQLLLGSVASIHSQNRDTENSVIDRFCRICHSLAGTNNPLISPCRCTGSLKYVHHSCLLHWLQICSMKLRRPAICELCLYKYRRKRSFNWRHLRFAPISQRDLRFVIVFIASVLTMIASAIISVICFYAEAVLTSNYIADELDDLDWNRMISLTTFIAAFTFFTALFVATYTHIKTGVSFVTYVVRCWSSNQEWLIEEYRPCRDERYCHKLELLRRRLYGECSDVQITSTIDRQSDIVNQPMMICATIPMDLSSSSGVVQV